MPHYPEQLLLEIQKDLETGILTPTEVARKHNCSRTSIYYYIKQRGWKVSKRPTLSSPKNLQEIKTLLENGKSTKEIAQHLGYTVVSINKVLKSQFSNPNERRPHTTFSGELLQHIRRDLEVSGLSREAVSLKYGCPLSTIGHLIKRHKWHVPKRILNTPEMVKKIKKFLEGGKKASEIATLLGFSTNAINAFMKRNGLEAPYKNKKLSSDQIKEIQKRLFEKHPIKDIAQDLKTSMSTIRSYKRDFDPS